MALHCGHLGAEAIADENEGFADKFVVSNTPVMLKLVKSDDGALTTSSLVFSKSVSQLRRTSIFGALTGSSGGGKIDKLLPVALHEILDIRAGCARSLSSSSEEVLDIDLDEIWEAAQLDNKECGQFMTIIATATPASPARYVGSRSLSRSEATSRENENFEHPQGLPGT